MTTEIVKGSLTAVAQATGRSLAKTFVEVDAVILVDTSGSMGATDSRGNRRRFDVACEELEALQGAYPGKLAILTFSDSTVFCPDGRPVFLGGGTDLAGALRFAKVADTPGMRFIVISDGEPNNEIEALAVATTYQSKIDVIFVGPENQPYGRNFLQKLAAQSGGVAVTADRVKDMGTIARKLLAAA